MIINYINIDGISLVKSYGFSGEFNIFAMELLRKSLDDIFQSQKKKIYR